MDRRKSIKTLVIGGFSIGAVAEACNRHENSPVAPAAYGQGCHCFGHQPDERRNSS